MPASENLATIRTPCIAGLSKEIAQVGTDQTGFQLELIRFFDALEQALQDGEAGQLEHILDDWEQVSGKDLILPADAEIPRVLESIFSAICIEAEKNLGAEEGLDLAARLFPLYRHALEHSLALRTGELLTRLEYDLRTAEESEATIERSKADFIAIASHELRTPLTVVEGYAAMLQEIVAGDPQATRIILGLISGTRRLRNLIDDLIDVTLLDNQLLVLNYQPGWIHRILEIISGDLVVQFRNRNQMLELVPFPGWDDMFYFDGERVYQALSEVILNAVKFTPDGGRIVIGGRTLPGLIEITVKDTGIGIDPEQLGFIFEKFARLGMVELHSSGKSRFKGGGLGLGLTIAQGIFEAHGGTIWAEARGRDEINLPGTTFHLLLPMRKEPPQQRQRPIADS